MGIKVLLQDLLNEIKNKVKYSIHSIS